MSKINWIKKLSHTASWNQHRNKKESKEYNKKVRQIMKKILQKPKNFILFEK